MRMPEPGKYMPDWIKEQSELAHTYAEDGAYGTAASILTDLAIQICRHRDEIRITEKGK